MKPRVVVYLDEHLPFVSWEDFYPKLVQVRYVLAHASDAEIVEDIMKAKKSQPDKLFAIVTFDKNFAKDGGLDEKEIFLLNHKPLLQVKEAPTKQRILTQGVRKGRRHRRWKSPRGRTNNPCDLQLEKKLRVVKQIIISFLKSQQII